MKLIEHQSRQWLFESSRNEKLLLASLLQLFPLVPPDHHRLSRNARLPGLAENQRWLEESQAAQQAENRRRIAAWLEQPGRFQPRGKVFRFALDRPELEWFLQVLNDVRVGSWLACGSPDLENLSQLPQNKIALMHLRRMELAGAFVSFFLAALEADAT